MARMGSQIALVAAALALTPAVAMAQAHEHDPGTASHDHAMMAVDCTTLASPPWIGLGDADRERFGVALKAVSDLSTPDAAIAAGFRPALGDIPGMGVHYVNGTLTRDGVHANQPDHLMFAPVDGEQTLVGAAYAFVDVPDTEEPIPYESDLARWHDHPQFAPDGQTLHMLHLWFVPSSNGPFAGLNFWLPFYGAGITPPSSCWMSDPEVAQQIQEVAFALVPPTNPIALRIAADNGWEGEDELPESRRQILDDLDAAAGENDLNGWIDAADRFQESLTERERIRSAALLQTLSMAQMSSAEREGRRN